MVKRLYQIKDITGEDVCILQISCDKNNDEFESLEEEIIDTIHSYDWDDVEDVIPSLNIELSEYDYVVERVFLDEIFLK